MEIFGRLQSTDIYYHDCNMFLTDANNNSREHHNRADIANSCSTTAPTTEQGQSLDISLCNSPFSLYNTSEHVCGPPEHPYLDYVIFPKILMKSYVSSRAIISENAFIMEVVGKNKTS